MWTTYVQPECSGEAISPGETSVNPLDRIWWRKVWFFDSERQSYFSWKFPARLCSSCAHSPGCLSLGITLFCPKRVTTQINHMLTSPHLRFCFIGTQGKDPISYTVLISLCSPSGLLCFIVVTLSRHRLWWGRRREDFLQPFIPYLWNISYLILCLANNRFSNITFVNKWVEGEFLCFQNGLQP